MTWFAVDKNGLGKLVERKGKSFVLFELIQNAWDESTTVVTASLETIPGRPRARLTIEDDSPDGFADLRHAYTLFAESKKKSDATKRGRFNLGEKLVLSLCDEATIVSTSGGVRFDPSGRHIVRQRRDTGSRFEAIIRLTRDEVNEILESVQQLRPPAHVVTSINGQVLKNEPPIKEVQASLPTEIADAEGVVRRSNRKTTIRIYEPKLAVGWIYEMGIPIVETGDRFDVDIAQKVPMSLDRDNVTPKFLQQVRTIVRNATASLLTKEESAAEWVTSAAGSGDITRDAIKKVLEDRFDPEPLSFDPSDMEANDVAASMGRRPVSGGAMPKGMWAQARRHGVIKPAGQVFPTRKPYSDDGRPENVIAETDWSAGMHRIAEFSQWAAHTALGIEIDVKMTRAGKYFAACYGQRELTFNLDSLGGEKWFDGNPAVIVDLVIHELGHEIESNHLSDRYYKALTMIAGKLFINSDGAPTLKG
ncbi:MAG: ATP-binding protein [Pirellulaceae bacterium]|nr:ATP-binding protein [Pirellulaceae bacterium]